MLYPSLTDLLGQVNSRYMLVNIIARRAREISGGASDDPDAIEKPVSCAIAEIASGELKVTLHNETDI